MLVSAISESLYSNNVVSSKMNASKIDAVKESGFYSLSPQRKTTEIEKLALYDSINEWKNFCHNRILKGKLDIIA